MSTVVSRKIYFFTTAVSSNSGDKHPGIKMLAKLRRDKLQCIGVHTKNKLKIINIGINLHKIIMKMKTND